MFLNLYLLKSLYKEHLENEKGALIPMQHFVIHFIIHSWICVILLSTTLSRVKKSSNVFNVIKLRNGIFEGNTKNVLLFFF